MKLITAPHLVCVLAVIGTLASLSFAEIGGRSGRSKTFNGTATVGNGECRFSISLEPVSFAVNSVAGKYKLVEVSIENRGTTPLVLSSDQDHFDAVINGQVVPAVLSLQRADSVLWDSYSISTRKDLAYPLRVGAAMAAVGGRDIVAEYMSMFVFLPADRVSGIPTEFRYTIASLGTTVTLRQPPATAQ